MTKFFRALVLLGLCLLLLSGCRTRTGLSGDAGPDPRAQAALGAGSGEGGDADAGSAGDPVPGEGSVTTEVPSSLRREYDPAARAVIQPGASHLLHAEGDLSGASSAGAPEAAPADRLDPAAVLTATQTIPTGMADRKGTGADAEEADAYLTFYSVLLEERLGSLFECKRPDLYWETAEPLRTVFRLSPEHQWILQSGCYDVSARLLEENLTVAPDWVVRKNPGVIVKVADRSVLGFGVSDPSAARLLCQSLADRPGWSGIDAVRAGRVLLVSEQLLASRRMRLAAQVQLAKLALPDLFADIDADEALRLLLQEETGADPDGLFIYVQE